MIMEKLEADEWLKTLKNELLEYFPVVYSRESLKLIQAVLNLRFSELAKQEKTLIFYPGLEIIGAKPVRSLKDTEELRIIYKSKFYPHRRYYPNIAKNSVSLGYYKDWDLYFFPQERMLSAYGNINDTRLYSLRNKTIGSIMFLNEPFNEIIIRLKSLNYKISAEQMRTFQQVKIE